jgi:hypothetical protein
VAKVGFSCQLRLLHNLFIFNKLPRMDSNHDKVIQSHLCYRYTTRQKGGEFGTSDRDNVNPSTSTGQAFEKACSFAKAMEDTLARLLGFCVGMIFDPIATYALRSGSASLPIILEQQPERRWVIGSGDCPG